LQTDINSLNLSNKFFLYQVYRIANYNISYDNYTECKDDIYAIKIVIMKNDLT